MEITVIELAFYALKEEAIRRHRLMWNWIADEAERTHKPVTKMDAFDHFGWDQNIRSKCWCCEYAHEEVLRRDLFGKMGMCEFCPLDWSQGNEDAVKARCVGYFDESMFFHIGPFEEWCLSSGLGDGKFYFDPERFISLARTIANLPEKKEK